MHAGLCKGGSSKGLTVSLPLSENTAIKLVGDFAWDEDTPAYLKELDLDIPKGSLVAIVGSTGSGKTSILSAALSLMKQLSGPPVEIRGKVMPSLAFNHWAVVGYFGSAPIATSGKSVSKSGQHLHTPKGLTKAASAGYPA